MKHEPPSTGDSLAKGRNTGAFRCLNCFSRVSPPAGAETYQCRSCGFQWRVFWISPDVPRIRGPVWDVNRHLAEETSHKEEH